MSRWPSCLYTKTQLTPAAKQGSGSTPHRLRYPDKSGNERAYRWGEWVWPRAARSGVDPPQFTASRWAAEMSSRTDGPEQITNNTQRSKTAETHCWRWLILQTEIWGRIKEKRGSGGKRREGGRAGTQRGENRSIRYKTQKYMFPSQPWKSLSQWNPSRFPNTFFLERRGRKENLDIRKASAGGKVNRQSLLYSSHFIHLVGLIKCQVEFLDI